MIGISNTLIFILENPKINEFKFTLVSNGYDLNAICLRLEKVSTSVIISVPPPG